MKQAIIGLHSTRGSNSQVTKTSTDIHGQKSHLRTLAVGSTSMQAAHRPKPTIFVSIFLKLYFKHEFKCFIAISNNEKTIETRGPPDPSVLLFSSCLSSQ